MDQTSITIWLQKRLKRDCAVAWAIGFASLAASIAILAFTWCLAYMTLLVTLGRWLGYHHWLIYTLPWIFLPLLFWGNSRTSREYLSEYSVSTLDGSGKAITFFLPGVGLVSNVNPLAPQTVNAGAKLITDLLYTGPRVLVSAFRNLAKARHLQQLDVGNCGAVLTLLMANGRKMSFQEIVNILGEDFNPVAIFPQMALVEGVLFLKAEPAGLSLSQDMRDTICQEA